VAKGRFYLLACALFGCNAVFGIERHSYREEPATGGVQADGGAAAEAGTPGETVDSDGRFLAFWDFESLSDDQTATSSGPAMPLTVQQGELSPGPTGNHLVLTGSGSAAAPGPIVDASSSFSISVWVRLDEFDTWNTFVSQDGEVISPFYLQKRDSSFLGFTTYTADSVAAEACVSAASLQPKLGEWYHVVATRDATSGEQRIYVDGVLSGKATCAGGFRAEGPLIVGRGKWDMPTDWMVGGIDELGVTNRILAPAEVVELYRLGRPDARYYLFAYFQEVEQGRGDGLHLAHSHDALAWNPVGAGHLFFSSALGGGSFRDPHLLRDPNGTYHLVWTSSCVPWADGDCVQDRGFGYATTRDLVTFSEPVLIGVAQEKLNVEHFWAPETFYDARTEQYLVTWSSPLDVTAAADPHSIYYLLTRDFVTFSEPAVLYGGPDRNLLDATIIEQNGAYVMFLKDEAEGQKNLRAVTSPSLFGEGAWTNDVSLPLTSGEPAEGPAPVIREGNLLLFFDKYGAGALGALRSRDLAQLTNVAAWEDISTSTTAVGLRHGSVFEAPYEVFHAVALKAAE
jgi:hypothetical protein